MTASPPPALPRVTRILLLLLLLSPLSLAIPRLLNPPPDPETSMNEPESAPGGLKPPVASHPNLPADPRRLRGPVLGFTINAHRIESLARYGSAVDSIDELGANTLLLVTPMYQETVRSTEIRRLPEKCPTDEQLIAILNRARTRGLQTVLMPIVLVEKTGDKEWRGVIEPESWDRWWQSYEAFLDHFLSIAEQADADMFSIGSELNSTEDQVARWESLVGRARQRFDGLLTYSANWDRYAQVQFWPLVDIISVSSYFELERDTPGAPEEALVRAWAPLRAELLDHAERWQRPLLMSEVGYPSLPWANAHPWNYTAEYGEAADHQAQARCWSAFFQAWTPTMVESHTRIIGFCGYRWDPYHQGGPGDTGYGIRGKPAMDVVRRGFRRMSGG